MVTNEFAHLNALIIDDESMMRTLLTSLLHEIGFAKILDAEDGAQAFRVLKDNPNIDIVICDLEMPIIGGLEFVEMLRTSTDISNPKIPVLIITGHSETKNVHKAVRLGIHGFLVKPVSHTALKGHIIRALKHPTIDPANLVPKKRALNDVEVLDFNKRPKG